MIITKLALPRRTFLKGLGATVALPLLDAMVPAMTAIAKTAADPVRRLSFLYMPMGCDLPRWTPASTAKALMSRCRRARRRPNSAAFIRSRR